MGPGREPHESAARRRRAGRRRVGRRGRADSLLEGRLGGAGFISESTTDTYEQTLFITSAVCEIDTSPIWKGVCWCFRRGRGDFVQAPEDTGSQSEMQEFVNDLRKNMEEKSGIRLGAEFEYSCTRMPQRHTIDDTHTRTVDPHAHTFSSWLSTYRAQVPASGRPHEEEARRGGRRRRCGDHSRPPDSEERLNGQRW
jgi:hypothetical protein